MHLIWRWEGMEDKYRDPHRKVTASGTGFSIGKKLFSDQTYLETMLFVYLCNFTSNSNVAKKSHDGAFQKFPSDNIRAFWSSFNPQTLYIQVMVLMWSQWHKAKKELKDPFRLNGGCNPPISVRIIFYSSSAFLGQYVFLPQRKTFVIKPFLCSIPGHVTKRIFLPASSVLLDVLFHTSSSQAGGMEQKSDLLYPPSLKLGGSRFQPLQQRAHVNLDLKGLKWLSSSPLAACLIQPVSSHPDSPGVRRRQLDPILTTVLARPRWDHRGQMSWGGGSMGTIPC